MIKLEVNIKSLKKYFYISFIMVLLLNSTIGIAQEMVAPLKENSVLFNQKEQQNTANKTRAGLPFIDDFSYDGPFPNSNLWLDNQAFINNTMSATPVTKGIATLDGLNSKGRPYFKTQSGSGFADSLTSIPLDLSIYNTNSNLYISFFYQPQGLGFAPEAKDSLFLFFKNNLNEWQPVWKIKGSTIQAFRFVILPINDAQFLHSNFQFRFVNIASLDINNDTWNIDYVKLDANRNINDSINHDIAFTIPPTSILFPYSSMPYRHFVANQGNEKAISHDVNIRNLYATNQSVAVQEIATEIVSSTTISTSNLPSTVIPFYTETTQSFNPYNVTYTAPSNTSKVVIQNKYFYSPVNSTDRKENDTITRNIVFDNYFAYDDGSAEKSYFLLAGFNFAAKTALEFHLNQTDSIRGLMVHFGPQVPSGAGKLFNIVLYKTLGGISTNDSIILEEDFNTLQYVDTIDGFTKYAFSQPQKLDAGTYYIGITQPANSGSDSIYYGLDVNNNTNIQHLYYSVTGSWLGSTTAGSIMMRPIVGQAFSPTSVQTIAKENATINIYPNPCDDNVYIENKYKIVQVQLFSMLGSLIEKKQIRNNEIDVSHLPKGLYILEMKDENGHTFYQKINKK